MTCPEAGVEVEEEEVEEEEEEEEEERLIIIARDILYITNQIHDVVTIVRATLQLYRFCKVVMG